MSEQGFKGVPGVPEGWELVRIDFVTEGEWYLFKGRVDKWESKHVSDCDFPILRKIEVPKQWLPFANAEEFKPHRDRWARRISDGLVFRCTSYGGGALVVLGNILPSFAEAFQQFVFDDDGTPFGVEVIE
jgi:hypothetical protein